LFSLEPSIGSSGPAITAEQIRAACWAFLGIFAVVALAGAWMEWDARGYLLARLRQRRAFTWTRRAISLTPWADLEERAKAIVAAVLARLPPDLLAEAEQMPVLFEEGRKTPDGRVVLGLYGSFTPGRVSDNKGPIFLYLRNIEKSCAERGEDFAKEVGTTYLHELGHHFGWGEAEVEERGL
jgi:predicted Zn-dependent protease with MMP-like domain